MSWILLNNFKLLLEDKHTWRKNKVLLACEVVCIEINKKKFIPFSVSALNTHGTGRNEG